MAALLLTYMDEVEAFVCLQVLIKKHGIKDIFARGMPGLARTFYVHLSLMKKYMPKLLKHLLDEQYEPSIYATQWFLTSFIVHFDISVTVRIWDMFIIEGHKALHRIALAIFKLNQEELLKCKFETLNIVMKKAIKKLDPEQVIKVALKDFKFSRASLNKIEEQYDDKKRKG